MRISLLNRLTEHTMIGRRPKLRTKKMPMIGCRLDLDLKN